MLRLASAWDRVFGRRWSTRKSKVRCPTTCSTRRASFEALEERQLLSVCTWSGVSDNNKWSTPDNWTGGVPGNGDEVVLSGTTRTNTIDDLSGVTFKSIRFASNNFTVAASSGNSVRLTDAITLDTGVSSAAISAPVVLGGSVAVNVVDTGAALTVSGVVSGVNSLQKTGAGELILSAGNTYSGGTVINGGKLTLGSGSAIGSSNSGITVSGKATLNINGQVLSTGAVVLVDGAISGGTLIAPSYTVSNGEITANLGGSNATVVKISDGTVTLSGENTYGGFTCVVGGTLELATVAQSPILTGGGADIRGGQILFDYAQTTDDPAATIQSILTTSYGTANHFELSNNANIYSSSAASAGMALGWKDGGNAVAVIYARSGDANLNGVVNMDDLAILSSNSGHVDTKWADADFNYDTHVNNDDLAMLLSDLGNSTVAQPPEVVGVYRLGAALATSNTVQYVVVFSRGVSGVELGDFGVSWTNTNTASAVHVTNVVGYGPEADKIAYLVTISDVYGSGTLSLTLSDQGNTITCGAGDLTGNGASGSTFTGEAYSMDAPFIWDGGGSDSHWNTAANWACDVMPASGDDVLFTGTTRTTIDISGATFGSVEFAATGFTLKGTSAAIDTGIRVDEGVSATISADIAFGDPMTLDIGQGGSLTLSGALAGGDIAKTGPGTAKLSGDTSGLLGDETVQEGALLLGALDSVFADCDDFTFNSRLSTAFGIAEPPDIGGDFSLSIAGLTGDEGDATIAADGTVQWTPGTNCEGGSYIMLVTYGYDGGLQTKAFSLTVTALDTPPVFPPGHRGADNGPFPEYDVEAGPDYCLGNVSCFAVDVEDASLSYSFVAASTNPPANSHLDTNGFFCCTFAKSDAGKVFDFFVKATDSSRQYDYKRLSIAVCDSLLTDEPTPFTMTADYNGVTEDTAAYLNSPSLEWEFVNPDWGLRLVIDQTTTHGTLTLVGDQPYYVPNPGYRGLDTYTCHWQLYNTRTMLDLPSVCNVAPQYIQVGSAVDLTPANKYASEVDTRNLLPFGVGPVYGGLHPTTDDAELGLHERSTMTLTVQDPWGDAVPATGCWRLAFDRNVIKVYDSEKREILPYTGGVSPYSDFLVTNLTGQQEKTLTVVGVGVGDGSITAYWDVWNAAGVSSQDFNFHWRTTAHYIVVGVDLTIFNGGSDLDNGEAAGSDGDVVADDKEETEGAYLLVNWDDDDADGQMNADGTFSQLPVPDLTETTVLNEDNLAKLVMSVTPSQESGIVELAVTQGADKVKLWTQKTKGTQIALTDGKKTWDLSNATQRAAYFEACQNGIWMEGIASSAAERDVTLVLRYTKGGKLVKADTVKATVVMINLGNAVYRDNMFPGMTARGHVALVAGFTGPCTRVNLFDDTRFTIIEMDGPTGNRTLDTITNAAGYACYGCFTNTAITYVGRLRVLAAAKALVARAALINYEWNDALLPGNWNGHLDTITHLRCDGLVEVCYEINGIEVWAMRRNDGTYNFNIADTTDDWTYYESTGVWTAGGNGLPDNLEEHNDYDWGTEAGWNDTLMPATQCGHVTLDRAQTRFTAQNLCGPIGSTGGN